MTDRLRLGDKLPTPGAQRARSLYLEGVEIGLQERRDADVALDRYRWHRQRCPTCQRGDECPKSAELLGLGFTPFLSSLGLNESKGGRHFAP
ncbi:MAG: hypothetical protein NVS9B1_11600 [Candidatus Dormibacteraceae bacterium]